MGQMQTKQLCDSCHLPPELARIAAMRSLTIILLFSLGQAMAAPAVPETDEHDSFINQSLVLSQITSISKSVGNKASGLVVDAMGFLGVPYKRGGTGQNGFDCSGFVRAMYENSLGLILPHNAKAQAAATEKIDPAELQPGDLVFFNTLRKAFSHVGIYIGEGKFIHSPRAGGEVRIENMSDNYWHKRFNGARRVSPEMLSQSTDSPAR
jgi:cell wall-associated NlpC family hydrolase